MNENLKNITRNERPTVKIIRISKKFSSKNKIPQNIMIINNGKNQIEYNLTQKISKIRIMESLKTIQNSLIYDNENNNIYYTSYKYKITENINSKPNNRSNRNIQKNKSSQYLHQLLSKESNMVIKNNLSKPNIYNMKITDIDKKDKSKKESIIRTEKRRKSFNGFSKLTQKESDRYLLNIKDSNNKKEINHIPTQRKKRKAVNNNNLSKKEMTINNSQIVNQLDNNNIDKISGLVNIKENKSLYENEKLSNIIDKYSKNITNDKACIICERVFSIIYIYCAKCNIHFFCKECLKIYCQNLIEKGIKRMKCPIYKCDYDLDKIQLEEILDKKYYQYLFGINNYDEDQKTIMDEKIKSNIIVYNRLLPEYKEQFKKFKLYQNKNVFQIDPSFSLSKIKKYEEEYCPKCHEQSLFCLTPSFYNVCLNCGFKSCKYCNKEYTNSHLIMNNSNHCKVYYRRGRYIFNNSNNNCWKFITQIIYIIAIYLIVLKFLFLTINKFFFVLFGIKKDKRKKSNSCFELTKKSFCYFFSCLIYLIILPAIIILIPFFPVITALLDGN